MADFAVQRRNMVECQVQPSDVTDRRILRAMLEVPREEFAAPESRATAYMDESLAMGGPGHGAAARAMVAPRILAKLMQALELGEQDVVLVVGAGSGYGAAVLSKMARSVIGLEADPALAERARRTLASLGIANVKIATGEPAGGFPAEAPYDAILVEGSVPEVPGALLDQLKDDGRLAAVVSGGAIGRAMQWRRLGDTFDARALFDAAAPQLPGLERKPVFVF